MNLKVISGGQTGADQAGLFAARENGLQTGGWMPKGFKTQDGNRPEFYNMFGVKETLSTKYNTRTYLNVKDSDGTLRIASKWVSPGEILTLKFINELNKPKFDIDPKYIQTYGYKRLYNWIINNNIKVLNVAGNSERTRPYIYDIAFNYLDGFFKYFINMNRG